MVDITVNATGKSAVVLGGSMAGLVTAQVLTKHFDTVTIIERDRFPKTPESRSGVPQARHIHILLMRGKLILEQLFPGIMAELTASGALTIDWTAETLTLSKVDWLPRYVSNMPIHTCSRDLLEWTVRQRLAANPKVKFIEETQVVGVLSNADKSRVTGVQLRSRQSQSEQTLNADFVVDATGRGSKMSEWLQGLGYAAPRETVINSFQGYATRWFKRPAHLNLDWKALIVSTKPPHMSRGGGIYPVENDQWIVTLGGVNKDFPPNDEAGFMEFARSLRTPLLAETLAQAEPISPVYGYQRTENRLRHYEELTAMPEGIVALGDAVCAFNPIYGQGMTAAALGATVLDECLKNQDSSALELRFQKALAKSNETAWLLATSEDFRWQNTEGERPKMTPVSRFVQRYMEYVTELITEEPAALTAFYQVAHLVQPPTALFQPTIALRVLQRVLKGKAAVKDKPIGQPPTWEIHEQAILTAQ